MENKSNQESEEPVTHSEKPKPIADNVTPTAGKPIQIDDLETYNEDHGHRAGGYALYTVARTIRSWLEPDEEIARYDENQCIVLLPGTDAQAAFKIATHLRHLIGISEIVTLENEVYPPASISVGVHWDFGDHHPRIVVHEALKQILKQGAAEKIREDYTFVE